jgi:hypothetical protein
LVTKKNAKNRTKLVKIGESRESSVKLKKTSPVYCASIVRNDNESRSSGISGYNESLISLGKKYFMASNFK